MKSEVINQKTILKEYQIKNDLTFYKFYVCKFKNLYLFVISKSIKLVVFIKYSNQIGN